MNTLVIVEDERLAVEKLRKLVDGSGLAIGQMIELSGVEEAVNWFASHPAPDLVFMDVQLRDGTCFEIFENIRLEAPVIFTTAFDTFAIRAFEVNSIDYLLKPIDPELFGRAIAKFKNHYASGRAVATEKLLAQLPAAYKTRFLIRTGIHFKSVSVAEIEAFFVQEGATFLQTKEGKTLDVDQSLDQLEKMVDPGMFYRVNRNYLLNIHYIRDMIGYSGSRIKVKMAIGNYPDAILVSRERVNSFKQWMDR
ncbi:MAG: LytTR family DNA-binding domain-containing protein [Marinilabiliales bacterium]|nr:LytTR family DNA-binding domain-containing protein [Marinilabiliales bacterium]